MSASAAIITTGSINPSGVVYSDTNNAPPSPVSLGQQGAGTLTVYDGSFFAPSMLYVGAFGQGDAHIQGPRSVLSLTGINYTRATRLIVGQSGVGALTISNGAVLDGTQRASDGCDNGACGAILAHGAGSQGRLTVTGSGSQASFLGGISLAQGEVYTLENGGFVYGTPGAQARADMQILAGARVTSGSGVLASAPTSPAALGTETSLATVLIDGPGSVWTIQRTAANSPQPFLALASHAHGTAQMMIRNGGKLVIDGGTFGGTGSSAYTAFNLSRSGSGHVTVTGAGSAIEMAGHSTIILVGRERGSATLEVLDGASANTQNLQIGNGSVGVMRISGNGSVMTVSGRENASTIAADRGPLVLIGRAGTGRLEVSDGAVLRVDATVHDGGPAYSAPARLIVAATSDAQGTLDVLRGGLVQASFIGIARANGAHTSGSALVRIDGGEITADTVEIGLTGHLVNNGVTTAQVTNWGVISGSGTFVGDLINHGTINPGNSPGTLTVQGIFTSAAGSQIVLEIADDGRGGFVTDRLVINGAAAGLDGAKVRFQFLGATDPNAFLASGQFDTDTFFGSTQGGLDPARFAGVTFSAGSDGYHIDAFSFDVVDGARIQAQLVPEPATYGLMLLGLAGIGTRLVRRRTPAAA